MYIFYGNTNIIIIEILINNKTTIYYNATNRFKVKINLYILIINKGVYRKEKKKNK